MGDKMYKKILSFAAALTMVFSFGGRLMAAADSTEDIQAGPEVSESGTDSSESGDESSTAEQEEVTDLSQCSLEIEGAGLYDGIVYTGEELRPAVAVMHGTQSLDPSYYEVSYENNVDAGTAYVTVTGQNGVTGSISGQFRIYPAALVKLGCKVSPAELYQPSDGSPKTTAVTVKAGDKTLEEGRDYTLIFHNNILPGRAYVRVVGVGNYKSSLIREFYIRPDGVGEVRAEAGTDRLTLSWDKVEGADGYAVSVPYMNGSRRVALFDSPDVTEYVDEGLKAGTVYKYYVESYRHVDGKYIFSGIDKLYEFCTEKEPLAAPVLKAEGHTADSVTLSWSEVNGADGYELYRYNGNDWEKITEQTAGNECSYTDSGLEAMTVYKYRIAAFTNDGEGRIYSPYSDSVECETNSLGLLFYIGSSSTVYNLDKTYAGTVYANSFYAGRFDSQYDGYYVISYMDKECLIKKENVYVRSNAKVLPTGAIGQMGGSIYGSSACGPAAAAILVNWQKGAGWSKDDLIVYAENRGLNDQGSLRGGGGITAPNLIKLINQFSGGLYNAVNVYGGDTASNLKSKIDSGSRAIVVVQYTSYIVTHYNSGTHFVVVCGYEYIDGTLYFYYADPYYGNGPRSLLRIDAATLAASMDMVTREPRCIIIV